MSNDNNNARLIIYMLFKFYLEFYIFYGDRIQRFSRERFASEVIKAIGLSAHAVIKTARSIKRRTERKEKRSYN